MKIAPTYVVFVCLLVVLAFLGPEGAGWSSAASQGSAVAAGPESGTFVDHPRLFLTNAKRAELIARRDAKTPAYLAMKAYADLVPPSFATMTTLSAPLGPGGAGTTFTVEDGSAFPTAAHQVRIDIELLTVTRSQNTFTIVSRANGFATGANPATSHGTGAEIWVHVPTDYVTVPPALAMLKHIGVTGYEQRARAALGQLVMAYAPIPDGRYNGNTIRAGWWAIAVAYDWVHADLSANERTVFSAVIRDCIDWHLRNAKECFGGCLPRQRQMEAALTANIANGQLRATLALAAATYGDNPEARSQWEQAYAKVVNYLIPAMVDGPLSGGNNIEGSEYVNEVWAQTTAILSLVESSTRTNLWPLVNGWESRFAKYLFHAVQPGGRSNSGTITSGTIATGSTSLNVASAATFEVGQNIYAYTHAAKGNNLIVDGTTNTDVLPDGHSPSPSDVAGQIYIVSSTGGWKNGLYRIESIQGGKWRLNRSPAAQGVSGGVWFVPLQWNTVITGVSGTTLTVRDPAPNQGTNVNVGHEGSIFSYGDVEGYNNYDDYVFFEETRVGALGALDRLRVSNPTDAQYLKYFVDNTLKPAGNNGKWQEFLWYVPDVQAVDYTTSLNTTFSSGSPDSTGLLIGRSDWTPLATWVHFLVGGEMYDHATSYFNSYGFKRKGVWLTRNLAGYGPTGISWPPPHYKGSLGDSPFVGARYHNNILMNRHGPINPFIDGAGWVGPARLTRSEVSSGYVYGRGDASLAYQYRSNWTSLGFANDDARGFVRDFLYIKPDLVVFHDRVTYANPSSSPTQWNALFPGKPSMSGQRVTMTYAGQKLVQDIVIPSSSKLTLVDLGEEEDLYLKGYRLETVSGDTTNSEYSLQVLQGMDSGDSPATVTALSSTSANVAQIGSRYVVGAVKEGSDSLPSTNVTYTYTGDPTHFLMGFSPSTRYHVVNASGRVTITAATGSDDTTTTPNGLLIFPDYVPPPESLRTPAPGSLRTPPSEPTGLRIDRP